MKLWEKVNKEIATCLGKADKLAYRYVILCHSEKENTTGVIFDGTLMINMPDEMWVFDNAKLQKKLNISPEICKADNIINMSDEYEKAYVACKISNDKYKELLVLETEQGKKCNIQYEFYKKFFEADREEIEIYIKNEKSPVYIKWMEYTIGVILPVVKA